MRLQRTAIWAILLCVSVAEAKGQSFGIELLNNVMPASGGMAGTSIASPQDIQSAINGNPATLTQFGGTQFGFGSGWIEPTYNLSVDNPGLPLIGVAPFDRAKSDAQGLAAANIGVTQDLYEHFGLPITTGLGLKAGAGGGVDFRHVPEANGTHANLVALDIVAAAGVVLTERLSVGTSFVFSNASMDGPFVGLTGSAADYGIRGSVGANYLLLPDTYLGCYWQSKAGYTFENLARFQTAGPLLPTVTFDVSAERPEIFGLGISNASLFEGKLLLAMDAVHLAYADTDMFGAIYDNQWALQFGAQLAPTERLRFRCGYAWNENPMRDSVGDTLGGVLPPGAAAHVQYVEALFAAIPQHRITGGLSVLGVLPGVDFDLFAGGMFDESQTFGITTAEVESYWVGAGVVWRFGQGPAAATGCRCK